MNSTSKPDEKSKLNEFTDMEMKKKLRISYVIMIVGLAIILIWVVLMGLRVLYLFLFSLDSLAIIILGIIISLYGLYAVIANKSQLDRQKRIILRKIFSGSTLLIIGVILLSFGLWNWYFYGQQDGLSWGGGLVLYNIRFWMIIGAILIIIGLVLLISYRSEWKKALNGFKE